MKTNPKLFTLVLGLLTGAVCAAQTPVVQSLTATNVALGAGASTFQAQVSDAGNNLTQVVFLIAGPGISGWQTVSSQTVSGASASPSTSWTPSQAGTYTLQLNATDTNTTVSSQTTFEVYIGQMTVGAVTVASGVNRIYQYGGEIVTATSTSGDNVVAQSGGNLILWAGGRVKLEPGFHAMEGSYFWAAVDHDQNGYSDVEETECHYIAGVPDAWLVDHGFNLSTSVSSWGYTAAQLLAAYQGGYNPSDIPNVTKPVSANILVIRMPSGAFYGVTPGSWSIATSGL